MKNSSVIDFSLSMPELGEVIDSIVSTLAAARGQIAARATTDPAVKRKASRIDRDVAMLCDLRRKLGIDPKAVVLSGKGLTAARKALGIAVASLDRELVVLSARHGRKSIPARTAWGVIESVEDALDRVVVASRESRYEDMEGQ